MENIDYQCKEILSTLKCGLKYTYKSKNKKGRIFTIHYMKRDAASCDLYPITASDLKYSCGFYNEEAIIDIIRKAVTDTPQDNKRIR